MPILSTTEINLRGYTLLNLKKKLRFLEEQGAESVGNKIQK